MQANEASCTDFQLAGQAQARPWVRACLWLAFLGPFFFLTYGFANWWTGQLPHVPSLVFDWERHIPFLDWTILPYMSIDAFYAASLFLCATRAELDTHAKRLLAATVVSVAGFMLFPLQFSFVRPETAGFNGALFDILTGFDKPFNQAPSLHISLLLVLWLVYARHVRGVAGWLLHLWFFLIGISVFTTFQHHAIDGIAGAAVGVLCVYLFPDHAVGWQAPQRRTGRHARLAAYYLAASLACLALAVLIGGWGWLLLWPAMSLALVSLAYTALGVAVFQKNGITASWAGWILLAPYRIGAWISSRCFTLRVTSSEEIVAGVWIGRAPGSSDWQHLDAKGVLDLAAEFIATPDATSRHYRSVPMLDLVAPTQMQLKSAVQALDDLYGQPPVLVHCALGYSRSALVVAAWLLHRRMATTPAEAIRLIRRVRPQTVLREDYLNALEHFSHAQ